MCVTRVISGAFSKQLGLFENKTLTIECRNYMNKLDIKIAKAMIRPCRNVTMPICGYAKLSIDSTGSVSGYTISNLELTILKYPNSQTRSGICLKLGDISELELNHPILIGDGQTITNNGRTFAGVSIEEYPCTEASFDKYTSCQLVKDDIDKMSWCGIAASGDLSRFNWGGVWLANGNMYATDGHRMHTSTANYSLNPTLISLETLKLLELLADNLDCNLIVKLSDKFIQFEIGEYLIQQRLIDADMPDFTLPFKGTKADSKIVLSDKYLDAFKAVVKLHGKCLPELRLDCFANGAVELSSKNAERGAYAITLNSYVGSLNQIAFNAKYLLDACLSKQDNTMRFGRLVSGENNTPITIENSLGTALIMPIRL